MKKLIFLLAVMASVSLANAQKVSEKEVPSVVKSALLKNYPNAKELKWEKEKGNYEAGFEAAKTDYSLLIDASGNILETEVEINIDGLPANARTYITKNYPGKKIKEAAKITNAKGVTTYEAEVNGKDLIFDNSGKFLKEVKD
ncbi:PepSY-like domain-containing protein [Sphingobacterium multivorum]|uniref:PepSY-like domain-containing protein n=1 Tax=Sphingobacterium multivorum TaxID=28454 RepID=UPI002897F64D|nr:PepSY-like domain-containing protein [Sphingobacterium multivorum]